MKKKILICLVVVLIIIASFFTGGYVKEQKHYHDRMHRFDTLITFALEKAENEDLIDRATMDALISNVYAAYVLCDDPDLAARLHDIWNALIFDADSYIGKEEVLINQLAATLQSND